MSSMKRVPYIWMKCQLLGALFYKLYFNLQPVGHVIHPIVFFCCCLLFVMLIFKELSVSYFFPCIGILEITLFLPITQNKMTELLAFLLNRFFLGLWEGGLISRVF